MPVGHHPRRSGTAPNDGLTQARVETVTTDAAQMLRGRARSPIKGPGLEVRADTLQSVGPVQIGVGVRGTGLGEGVRASMRAVALEPEVERPRALGRHGNPSPLCFNVPIPRRQGMVGAGPDKYLRGFRTREGKEINRIQRPACEGCGFPGQVRPRQGGGAGKNGREDVPASVRGAKTRVPLPLRGDRTAPSQEEAGTPVERENDLRRGW